MPVGLVPPEPVPTPDPEAESRGQIHLLSETISALADRLQTCREERERIRSRMRDLQVRDALALRTDPRYMPAAFLAIALFFGTWINDSILLGPLVDAMLDTLRTAPERRVIARGAFALLWSTIGYSIGAKLAIGLRTRQRAAWLDLIPGIFYCGAMPGLAFFVGEEIVPVAPWILVPFALVSSLVPILGGYFLIESIWLLGALWRLAWISRRERLLMTEEHRLRSEVNGGSHQIVAAALEHEARFGRRPRYFLTDLARRLVDEASHGGVRDEAGAQGWDREGVPRPGRSDPLTGSPDDRGPEQRAELEYLRGQLARRAQLDDAELSDAFATRLP